MESCRDVVIQISRCVLEHGRAYRTVRLLRNRLPITQVGQWKKTGRIRRQRLVVLSQDSLKGWQRIVPWLLSEHSKRYERLRRVVSLPLCRRRVHRAGHIEE